MKKKKVPATASRARVPSDLADAGGGDHEAEEGAEEDDHQRQLEAEDGPVAGVPHPPGHHSHDHRRGDHLRQFRLFAVDLDPGRVADDDREAIRALTIAPTVTTVGRSPSASGSSASRAAWLRCSALA